MIYEARCPKCNAVEDYVRCVAEALNTPPCPRCGVQMEKVILTAPTGFVRGQFEAFRSSVDGTIIRNDRDMQEHNKRNGVVNMADGYDDEAIKAGRCYQKPEKDAKDLSNDVGAAVKQLNEGYKPVTGVYDGPEI